MRRIYPVIALILLIVAFIAGYMLGKSGEIPLTQELTQIKAERDQLTKNYDIALNLADSAVIKANEFKDLYIQADGAVKVITESKVTMAKHYEKKIKDVQRYTASQLDSFFVQRYTYRESFNLKLKPIVMPEWRASMIAEDLVRLDSVRAISFIQRNEISELNKTIGLRDITIASQDVAIAQKDTANSILLRREMTHAKESFVWKTVATKYKRQRNVVIAGATISLGTFAYFVLKR